MSNIFNKFNVCEHPSVITNKYTGDLVKVDCGYCSHCLVKKSDAKKQLCEVQKSVSKYCYFITLTYNTPYVPKMSLKPIQDYLFDMPSGSRFTSFKWALVTRMMQDPRAVKDVPNIITEKRNLRYALEHVTAIQMEDKSFGKLPQLSYLSEERPYILTTIPRHSKLHKFKDEFVEELVWIKPSIAEGLIKKNNTSANGSFPQFSNLLKYANVRDYQLFQKRLRKYLFTKTQKYEKIHSYYISEYSPKTFRPHFHLLLFFDSPQIAQNISQGVFKSWRLGRIDCQFAGKSASSYVSNYLNSTVSLPPLYTKTSQVRPKARFSKHFAHEIFLQKGKSFEETLNFGINGTYYVSNGKPLLYTPRRSHLLRLFPRLVPYGSSFLDESRELYTSVSEIFRRFRIGEPFETETPTNVSKYIFAYVSACYADGYKYENLPECYRIFLHYTRLTRDGFLLYDAVKGKILRMLYKVKAYDKCEFPDSKKLRYIEEFYSRNNYKQLVNQLDSQVQLFKAIGYDETLLSLYHVKKGLKNPKNTYILDYQAKNYKEVHYFRVKHKTLNDENNIFID